MQPIKANVTRCLPVECEIQACDNSGAKTVKIFTVVGAKTVKNRYSSCGVGDLVMASVKKMCNKCKVIKRKRVVRVICTDPRHKQRQG